MGDPVPGHPAALPAVLEDLPARRLSGPPVEVRVGLMQLGRLRLDLSAADQRRGRRVPHRPVRHPPPVRDGLAFACASWLLVDELANSLLGLADRPAAYPVAGHAQALAMHLGYGLALAATARLANERFLM